jgi:hypothetical protein
LPECRPIRRRCRPSSPARLLRIQAHPTPLHTVSIFPRPIPFLQVLIVAHASSPERPRRPLPASAVVRARASLLSPLSRAHVSPLRNAPARGQFGGPQRCPEATPASRRRVPLRNRSFRRARRCIPHAQVQSRRILHGGL